MKTIFSIIFFSTLSLSFAQETARIVRVKDGDTFIARWKGTEYTCRLQHVDAPELSQAFGQASCDSLTRLLSGKTFTVLPSKTDLYGRTLVQAWVDGLRLDSLMIRKGWAWQYVNYSHDEVLKQCMVLASQEGVGLWKCGKQNVCPPWLYRKYSVANRFRYCVGCR